MSGTLLSPGVLVTVTDDSAYASSGNGTVPLFIIGTHENKAQPDGVTLAAGTLPSNAGVLYQISSQSNLVQTFGNPVFYTLNGTPQDAYELNEQGLFAAYSYLGIANTAWVIRGAIDFTQLQPSSTAPTGEPANGTYWLDVTNTSFGLFESNGNTVPGLAWTSETPTVIVDPTLCEWDILIPYGASSATAALNFSGTLVLNVNGSSLDVVVTTGMSITNIVTAINNLNETNLSADVQEIGSSFYAVIRLSDITKVIGINLSTTS